MEKGGRGRRFDAWLYAGDSATYFVSGTTESIGGMIQGSVTLTAPDPALRDALQAASERNAKPKASAKTKTAADSKPKAGKKRTR
jgi:hypothetical protein